MSLHAHPLMAASQVLFASSKESLTGLVLRLHGIATCSAAFIP